MAEPNDALSSLPPLRDVIKRHDLAAKKSLGQNFLLDLNLTGRIARAAGPLEGVTVVEIGPGPGGLTRALLLEGAASSISCSAATARASRSIAMTRAAPGRLSVISGDALEFDPEPLVGGATTRVVANLPYNIATPLLIGWLTTEPWPPWFDQLTLMFQREVAERIVAAPGGKSYGRLAVLANWRCETKILFDISPKAFVPPPKVTSCLLYTSPSPRD